MTQNNQSLRNTNLLTLLLKLWGGLILECKEDNTDVNVKEDDKDILV